MKPEQFCAKAEAAVIDKGREYGNETNLKVVAAYWSIYIAAVCHRGGEGDFFDEEDVATMMELLKIARRTTGEYKADNFTDAAGYAAVAGAAAHKKRRKRR